MWEGGHGPARLRKNSSNLIYFFPKSWKKEVQDDQSSHFPASARESEGSPTLWAGNRPPAIWSARLGDTLQIMTQVDDQSMSSPLPKALSYRCPTAKGLFLIIWLTQSSILCGLNSRPAEPLTGIWEGGEVPRVPHGISQGQLQQHFHGLFPQLDLSKPWGRDLLTFAAGTVTTQESDKQG